MNDTPHGYTEVKDPTNTSPTPNIQRFELRPGECGFNDEWNDCETNRERSEMMEWRRHRNSGENTEFWYEFDIYFPAEFEDISPANLWTGQLHQNGGGPILMFGVSNNQFILADETQRPVIRKPLVNEENLLSTWHTIKVHARWAKDNTGFMKVWCNDEFVYEMDGPTMSGSMVYFKYGIYRSHLNRVDELPIHVVYYTKPRRSLTNIFLQND